MTLKLIKIEWRGKDLLLDSRRASLSGGGNCGHRIIFQIQDWSTATCSTQGRDPSETAANDFHGRFTCGLFFWLRRSLEKFIGSFIGLFEVPIWYARGQCNWMNTWGPPWDETKGGEPCTVHQEPTEKISISEPLAATNKKILNSNFSDFVVSSDYYIFLFFSDYIHSDFGKLYWFD